MKSLDIASVCGPTGQSSQPVLRDSARWVMDSFIVSTEPGQQTLPSYFSFWLFSPKLSGF
jgi:hypothetical protein